MEMYREKKTTSWADDAKLAAEISVQLMENYYNPEKYREIMRKYTAEKVMVESFPPMPDRDGYASRDIWLEIEYATRMDAVRRLPEKKQIRNVKISSRGNAIFFDEYRVFPMPDGTLYELKNIVVMPVYNQKIVGYYIWMDPYPDTRNAEKEKLYKEIISTLSDSKIDQSDLIYLQ